MLGLLGFEQLDLNAQSSGVATPSMEFDESGSSFFRYFSQAVDSSSETSTPAAPLLSKQIDPNVSNLGEADQLIELGEGGVELPQALAVSLEEVEGLSEDPDAATDTELAFLGAISPQIAAELAMKNKAMAEETKAFQDRPFLSALDGKLNAQVSVPTEKLMSAEAVVQKSSGVDFAQNASLFASQFQEAGKLKRVALDGALADGKLAPLSTAIESSNPSSAIAHAGHINSANALDSLQNPTARFAIQVQFGRPEWNSALVDKVAQMSAQNLSFADIQLDPPELGSLQVRVQVNQDQASIVFNSANAQVKEALEQGASRLREMFNAEGFSAVDVDVRDQSEQKQDQDTLANTGSNDLAPDEIENDDVQEVNMTLAAGVDHYV